jgi:hypothetical protein
LSPEHGITCKIETFTAQIYQPDAPFIFSAAFVTKTFFSADLKTQQTLA